MRVILYARVSTRDKDQNPETQMRILREDANRRGWTVAAELVEHQSAVKLRPVWAEALRRVAGKEIDAVMVLRLDRAFRSTLDAANGAALFRDSAVAFVCVTQAIDTSTKEGRLFYAILAAWAEFERELIRDRSREGQDRAKAEGKHVGRPAGATDRKPRRTLGYRLRYASQDDKRRLGLAPHIPKE